MLKSGRPRHEQISDWLRDQIEQGVLAPDDQLPSEHRLGTQFGVSRITIRRALQTLEHDGLIYRRQGLGSFVRDQRVRQGFVRLTDFIEDMAQAGIVATSRVCHFEQERATPEIASILGIPEGKIVIRLDRLRLGDGEPIAFDRTWLPVFYGNLLEGHNLEEGTIYRILEQDYQIPVQRGRYRIEAVNADAKVAQVLDVPEHRALLLIERVSMTIGDKPVYFQQRYYRSDRVAYELELARDTSQTTKHGMPLREFEPVFKSSQ